MRASGSLSRSLRHPAGGFTLIELLMVVAIIALLAGMILGGVGIARNAAKSVRCMASLRQIMVGVYGYANDWEDTVVPQYSTKGIRWFSNLAPYLSADGRMTAAYDDGGLQKTGSVLWGCPVFNIDYGMKARGGSGQVGYGMMDDLNASAPEPGYPYGPRVFYTNWAYYPASPMPVEPTKYGTVSEMTSQAQRVLVGETWDWYLDASWSGGKPVLAQLNSKPAIFNRSEARRHNGRANYAFVDGHAASLTGTAAGWAVLDPQHMP